MEVSHQQLFRVDKPAVRLEPRLLVETQTERVDASYKSVEKTDQSNATHLDKQRKNPNDPKAAANESRLDTKVEKQNSSSDNRLSPQDPSRIQAQAKVDQAVIQQLKQRDIEVKAHEQAHASVGGAHAGSASFTYTRGPNGTLYATGGEVGIDTSPVADDPQATLQKARQVQAAALAPLNPSSQDRAVAARASQMAANAIADLANERAVSAKDTADNYINSKTGSTLESGQNSESNQPVDSTETSQRPNSSTQNENHAARKLYNEVYFNKAGNEPDSSPTRVNSQA